MEDEIVQTEEQSEEKKLISAFNEAKFKVLRLHYSWTLCNSYRRAGRLLDWKWELDSIWDELSSPAKESGEDFEDKIADCDKEIKDSYAVKDDFYSALRGKHRLLKRIQDSVGMGGKMVSEDEDMIED